MSLPHPHPPLQKKPKQNKKNKTNKLPKQNQFLIITERKTISYKCDSFQIYFNTANINQ